MSERHLLECDQCQHPIELETRHAGQLVRCVNCQAEVTAPTMREIRLLPLAAPAALADGKQTSGGGSVWTAPLKIVFVAGLFLAIAGPIVGGLQFYNASELDTRIDPYLIDPEVERRIDGLTPLETLGLWQEELTRLVPDQWVEHENLTNRRRVQQLRLIGLVFFGAALLGVALIAGSIVWARRG